ncbi:MAG TPA: fused MFS/spermidine synthase [Allosphingosinicella sp.]|nr:fused MFS/spermidine synthase [Allosphingosinicella sp.]
MSADIAARERYARPLFVLTIVTGSFLLFLTQPMIARMALPLVGGAPAVWNSAMLVYQLLLLGGYFYADRVARLGPRKQVGIHLVLFGVAALWLPIGLLSVLPRAGFEPAFWVPWFLISSIGPLFFIVSAQAPLMQRWYALETARGDPYPLYAASNLGSFAGLLSYPLIVEPLMTLEQQSWLWTALYIFLVLLVAACGFTVPADAVEVMPEETAPPPTRREIAAWVALAAIPSGLMLSTTTHLTTDIVAMPLLWALPLGLYLLSFVIAFAARRGVADFITMVAPLVILIAGGLAFSDGSNSPFFAASLGLLLLFTVAVALHTEMFRRRPAVGHLTRFYLAMSFGGMLGGLFCAIVAPLVFDWAYEHPLLILAAAVLVPQTALVPWPDRLKLMLAIAIPTAAFILSYVANHYLHYQGSLATTVASIVISLLTLACLGRPFAFAAALAALMLSYGGWDTLRVTGEGSRTRSYFGIYEVRTRTAGGEPIARTLTHGTTLHGVQNLLPDIQYEPTSYYARRSGVGLALTNAATMFGADVHVGVIGLGSGTLACYARPGQRWSFFEIDPEMVEVARTRFTFLSRCAPQARVVLGDARLTIARQPPGRIHVLAVDAFSSDAVPMHLLTREALAVYGNAVHRDGLVLFHISNRYLNLEPVVADLAARGGWTSAMLQYQPNEEEELANSTVSVWIALSRNQQTINRLVELSGEDGLNWVVLDRQPGFDGWSDDHASILPLLNTPRWWPF